MLAERQTVAIHNTHDFHAFSAFYWANAVLAALGWRERCIDEALSFVQSSGLTQHVC
jgi:hypothetical protein